MGAAESTNPKLPCTMLRDLLFREFQCYICLSISLQNCMCFVAKHWHEVFVKIMSIYYKFIFWYFWIFTYVFKMLEAHVYFVVKAQVRCGDDLLNGVG